MDTTKRLDREKLKSERGIKPCNLEVSKSLPRAAQEALLIQESLMSLRE